MPRTPKGSITLAEERPVTPRRRRATRAVVAVLAVGVIGAGYVGLRGTGLVPGGPECSATTVGTTVRLDPEQMSNAATIVGIAMKRNLPARAATIAIATAIQESKLRNVEYGDRDSLGLFQQRPSQGWGTAAQIMTPAYATNRFYDALVKIEGYQTMSITEVAQAVQRSAAPTAYAQHEQEGRVLADTLYGYTDKAVVCRIDDAAKRQGQAALRAAASTELGLTATVTGTTLTFTAADARHAWGVAAWAVAKSGSYGVEAVSVAGASWQRADNPGTWTTDDQATGPERTVTVRFG